MENWCLCQMTAWSTVRFSYVSISASDIGHSSPTSRTRASECVIHVRSRERWTYPDELELDQGLIGGGRRGIRGGGRRCCDGEGRAAGGRRGERLPVDKLDGFPVTSVLGWKLMLRSWYRCWVSQRRHCSFSSVLFSLLFFNYSWKFLFPWKIHIYRRPSGSDTVLNRKSFLNINILHL